MVIFSFIYISFSHTSGRLALLAAAERASRELSNGLQLQFTGAGHFRNSVVYVRVKEDKGYEQLKTLAGGYVTCTV